MPFYFDESIHRRGEFVLGAYVFGPDPNEAVSRALALVGLDPERDEFKSRAKMIEHPEQQRLRRELQNILHMSYSYGVVVAPYEERQALGREAILGLVKICQANGLTDTRDVVFFDEGVFARKQSLSATAQHAGLPHNWEIHTVADSRSVRGLQLADLVAHTCALMLLDQLGLLQKMVKAGPDSGYPPDLDIELGFELWASVRYQFFSGGLPANVQSNEDMIVDVARYGLYIAESCSPKLRDAAMTRFGTQYLGCIH